MLAHSHVIEAFGGLTALARAIGVDPKLTTHWGRRGIPAKYWPRIEETEIARRLGITAGRLMRAAAALEPAEAA
ncbi:MAG TPA: YdaS family helix-turn-helix protein [Xanthobacteraceae bacterium]